MIFFTDLVSSEDRVVVAREKIGMINLREMVERQPEESQREEAVKKWEEGKFMGLCTENDDERVINRLVVLNSSSEQKVVDSKGIKD